MRSTIQPISLSEARPGPEGLVDSQDLFQSLVAEADEGVVVLEPPCVVRYANAAAEFLLGQRRENLVGEMFRLCLLQNDKPVRVNVLSADGWLRVVEWVVEPLPLGPAENLVLRLRDVTSLHQDAVRAREQVRRRDEFLATLSHELRNPLAAILNASVLLVRDDLEPDQRCEAGSIFHRQFDHLTRILDDLLDITRISRGKMELRPGWLVLGQVVRDALAAVADLVRKRRHTLQVDLPLQDVPFWGDPTRLEQMLVNLLNNAAKFTPVGGSLHVALSVLHDCVELRVRDNGPGIPEELLPRVFESFVQGPQPLDRDSGGLGIGLALTQSIVALHQGTVIAQPNSDGPGMTFVVRLPRFAAAEPTPVIQASQHTRVLRILLVEDQEESRLMLRQALQLDGHEVLEAADGPSGLAAIRENRLDVALVDIGLPGWDGYELARRVRQEESERPGRVVRLVAMTGYGMPRDVQAAHEAGFDSHLTKPLRYPDLRRFLAELPPGNKG